MPEGPEVKRVAVQLDQITKNETLLEILPLSGRYTKTPIEGLDRLELPITVWNVKCKGKFIYWYFNDGGKILFNTLGMTGTWKTKPNDYARILFKFKNFDLYYCDMRNFGTLKFVYGLINLKKKLNEIGPDMLSEPCTYEEFLKICKKHEKKTLVAFLMNQKIISGVGNIYKSEILYLSKLNPNRKIGELTESSLYILYNSIIEILSIAYQAGGSTIRNYSDLDNNAGEYIQFESQPVKIAAARNKVLVYNQKTDPLGNKVEKITLDDGRTTYWVPSIQL